MDRDYFSSYDDNVDMTVYLQPLIDKAYQVFKPYKFKNVTEVCLSNGCLDIESKVELETIAINYVSRASIYYYLQSAWQESKALVFEVKYLLPRIMELFAQGKYIHGSTEYVFNMLNLDKLGWWQPNEVEIIEMYAHQHFEQCIKTNNWSLNLAELIAMWDNAGMKVQPLLKIWQENLIYDKAICDYVDLHDDCHHHKSLSILASEACEKLLAEWADDVKTKKSLKTAVHTVLNQKMPISEITEQDWDRALWILDGYV